MSVPNRNGIYKDKNNTVILLFCIFTILVFYIAGKFMPQNLSVLGGELIFSLDYKGHLSNILNNFTPDLDHVQNCYECGYFYVYSWYHTLVREIINYIGELIGFNPFFFFLTINIIPQILFLWVFKKLLLNKYLNYGFILATLLFIFSNYQMSLFRSGIWYGLIHGVMVLLIAILFHVAKNINSISTKVILIEGIILGILINFFLNLGIGFLPIVAYTIVLLSIFLIVINHEKLREALKKIFIFYSASITTLILLNIFFLKNLILNFSHIAVRSYTLPANNETISQALTIRGLSQYSNFSDIINFLTISIILIIFFFFLKSNVKIKFKIMSILIYVFFTVILMGNQFFINIYLIVFKYLPLMSGIRASHRLYFYLMLIFFSMTIIAVDTILRRKSKIKRYLIGFFTISTFIIIIYNIVYGVKNLNFSVIPKEYFKTDQYFEKNENKSVTYLPYNSNSITESYSWISSNKYNNPSLYSNPFNSIYFIDNIQKVHTWDYSVNSFSLEKLVNTYLLDPKYNDTKDIISNLVHIKSNYVIIDRNFKWYESNVNIDEVINYIDSTGVFKNKKVFGNIIIYEVPETQSNCISYYGNLIKNSQFCFDPDNPKIFINRTKDDFVFEKLLYTNKVDFIAPEKYNDVTYDALTREPYKTNIFSRGLLIPNHLIEAYEISPRKLITYKIKPENKFVIIPVFENTSAKEDQAIEVHIGKKLCKIHTNSSIDNFTNYIVDVSKLEGQLLEIMIDGKGYYLIGYPYLLDNNLNIENGISTNNFSCKE